MTVAKLQPSGECVLTRFVMADEEALETVANGGSMDVYVMRLCDSTPWLGERFDADIL